MAWYDSIWSGVKKWAYKWVGGIFLEEKKDGTLAVSLGRVSFVGVLGYMVSIWEKWKPVRIDPKELVEALKAAGDLSQDTIGQAIVAATHGAPDLSSMPAGLMEVFYVLAGYILGGKALGALKEKWNPPVKP